MQSLLLQIELMTEGGSDALIKLEIGSRDHLFPPPLFFLDRRSLSLSLVYRETVSVHCLSTTYYLLGT